MQPIKLIEDIHFFQQLAQEERDALLLADNCFAEFADHQYLIREGEPGTVLYVILEGSAVVTKQSHPDSIIAVHGTGAVVGEMAFLTRRLRSASVMAHGKVTVFVLDSERMEQLDLRLQLKIKDQLIQTLVQRIDEMNRVLMLLVGKL